MRIAILALLLLPSSAAALPPPPPSAWSGRAAACPLWYAPAEPAALYPHPHLPPRVGDGGATLAEGSGWMALHEARGWIEVGRPDEALGALAGAPAGETTRLYRLAALDALGRWADLDAELGATGELPACGPLYELWRARAAAAGGRGEEADRALERLAALLPALGGWVELLALEAAAPAGDVARGEAAWARIQAGRLPALAHAEARRLLPELYAKGGRTESAILWHATLADESRGEERARHRLAAARLADRLGQRRRADDFRRRAVVESPAHAGELLADPALRARLGIEPLEAARILIEAGRPGDAETIAEGILTAAGGEDARRATLLRARARAARGDRAGAESDYASFLARWPGETRAADAAFERARLALVARDGEVARQRLESFLARWPGHARADDTLYLLGDSHHDDWDGRSQAARRAIEAFDRLVATRRSSYFADRAEMRAAHLAFALGEFGEAERRYRAYRGSESAREARYWTARALERQGRIDEARALWRSLATGGDEYYALLARERLSGRPGLAGFLPAGYAPAPRPAFVTPGDVLLVDPAGRAAAALLAIGKRRWAHAELQRALGGLGSDPALRLTWAAALEAWGFPDLALRIGVGVSAAGPPAYPAGFWAGVDRESRVHGLDGAYLMALIRQESLFDAMAVSPVGARGLMQIMPATGLEIAQAEGWPSFDSQILFHPPVSLHFGAAYLAWQRDRFGGFWPAVLAAYNGGPHNVAVWIEFPERQIDPELWVDRIPYRETRNYVKKIVSQWATYRRIYDNDVAAR